MASISNGLRGYAADRNIAYGEGMTRASGAGAPGANSQEMASIAADMKEAIDALCHWVASWF